VIVEVIVVFANVGLNVIDEELCGEHVVYCYLYYLLPAFISAA